MDKTTKARSKQMFEPAATDVPPPYEALATEEHQHIEESGPGGFFKWCRQFRNWHGPEVSSTSSERTGWLPHSKASLLRNTVPQNTKKAGHDVAKPRRLLQIRIGPLSPKSVLCHCGQRCDTTATNPGLPEGHVRCRCGYIVASTGSSFHPSPAPSSVELAPHVPLTQFPGLPLMCDCNTPMPTDKACVTCGLWLVENSTVLHRTADGFCGPARGIIRCHCSKLVNINLEYKVHHRLQGQGHYDYTLPSGAGKCYCGRKVTKTTFEQGHSSGCCVAFETRNRPGTRMRVGD
ncbi:hypothetical protein LTR85_009477 [Meristemomyces frigidus]|nr:hypothetical protein LTR85_009477 [Meristemomyces frigidus]